MNCITKLAGSVLLAATIAQSHAAQVAWTFTGNFNEPFSPERFDSAITDDPIADLLGQPRVGPATDLIFSLRIVVDTDATHNLASTTPGQIAKYEDAIVSASLTLNGVNFATVRRPSEFLSGALDESEIRITNQGPPGSTDNITLTLGTSFLSTLVPPLFQRYTVPFNQSLAGQLIESAQVTMAFNSINISGPGMFDSYALPAANGAFANANFVALGVVMWADFGPGLSTGAVTLETHEVNFSAAAVPLPGAGVLLLSALTSMAWKLRATRTSRA